MIGPQKRVGQTAEQAADGRGLYAQRLHRVVGQGWGSTQEERSCTKTLQHQQNWSAPGIVGSTGGRSDWVRNRIFTAAGHAGITPNFPRFLFGLIPKNRRAEPKR